MQALRRNLDRKFAEVTAWKSINWSRGAVVSRVLGLISFLLGTVCAMEAYRLWTGWAGSGVLPAAVAILFIVLAIGFAAFHGAHTDAVKGLAWSEVRQILIVVVAFALYVAFVPFVGFLTATWAFLFASTHFAAKSPAITAFLWSGALAVASHFVFKVGLGTALPVGPLGF